MGVQILIIDDEVNMAELLKNRLEKNGFEVLIENDGATGLESAKNKHPDLIILDVMLPNIEGYKICRMLKFDSKYKSIPIIMYSALGQESDIQLGMEGGADAYLTKPIAPDVLLSKIEELLSEDSR